MIRQIFSRRVGYAAHALRLMVQMQPLATVPVAELARRMAGAWPRTSATYLCKVVQALVDAGILASVRGSAGGYCLAQRASGVSLLDLVYALEGPLDGGCLLTPSGPCERRARCRNYSVLQQLQSEFSQLLSAITIEQLASNLPRSIDGAETGLTCAHLAKSSADP